MSMVKMNFLDQPTNLALALQDPRCKRAPPDGFGQLYKISRIDTGEAYVGLNIRMKLYDRLSHHGTPSSGCHKLRNALRKHGRSAFTLQLIDTNVPEGEVPGLEVRRITEHNTMYPNGYNLAVGGKVSPMMSEVVRQKQKATKATPASRARQSASSKEVQSRPGIREATGKKISAAHKKTVAKRSASAKASMGNPEVKARHKAAINTPEELKRKSEASVKSHADPISKAKRSAALKAAWVRRKEKFGGTGFKRQVSLDDPLEQLA